VSGRRGDARPVPVVASSAFKGFRFPPEVIVLFFTTALGAQIEPIEVVTDRAWTLLAVVDEFIPGAFHNTARYANNRIEAVHGRLKARLRPMRGLKRDRTARVIVRGHAFMQNLRRGRYELGVEARAHQRVAVAFTELARTISPEIEQGPLPREPVHLSATEPVGISSRCRRASR
jgi:DDE domain